MLMAGKSCKPGCICGRHYKSPEHRARIGMSVKLTSEANGGISWEGRAQTYDLEYIESQLKQAKLMRATATRRYRYWQSMLEAKKS